MPAAFTERISEGFTRILFPTQAQGAHISTVLQLKPEQGTSPPKADTATSRFMLLRLFLLVVALPILVQTVYLLGFAADRFVATVGVTVRSDAPMVPELPVTGLSGVSSPDVAMVYTFLTSADLVHRLNQKLDLSELLSPARFDPVYAKKPENFLELTHRWRRLMTPIYDSRSGTIAIAVQGFTPDAAKQIADAVLIETRLMLTRLSTDRFRAETVLAGQFLDRARQALEASRSDLVQFRLQHGLTDPTLDYEERLTLITSLQESLITARTNYGLLARDDPRKAQALKETQVITEILNDVRGVGGASAPAKIVVEHDALLFAVDLQTEGYALAKSLYDAAVRAAAQSDRHLEVFIEPVSAQSASFPRVWRSLFLSFICLSLLWAILGLTIYGFRDRQ
jgi:capsular polysaccharide transport system permease protein